MISFKGKYVRFGEQWFSPAKDCPSDIDVLFSFQMPGSEGSGSHEFFTLLINLTDSIDDIQAKLSKKTAYEIRRADAKDGAEFFSWKVPDAQVLNEFCDFFRRFAQLRGLQAVSAARLKAYAEAGALMATRINDRESGKVLGWHIYVTIGKRARLLYSASMRLSEGLDAQERARLGRLNRWHHWKDILFCKEAGFDTYDLGGYVPDSQDREIQGISRFKEEFSQVKERSFDSRRALTWRGKAYLFLRGLRG